MRRLPTFSISIILLGAAFAAAGAGAQGRAENADPISACKENSSDAEARIACLEDAIRAMRGEGPDRFAAAEAQEAGADPDAPSGLGAEQVMVRQRASGEDRDANKEDSKESKAAAIVISEVIYNRAGDAVFFTEDGQIWRETGGDPLGRRLSTDEQYTAEITKALFGGYRMNIEGVRRMFKVERLK